MNEVCDHKAIRWNVKKRIGWTTDLLITDIPGIKGKQYHSLMELRADRRIGGVVSISMTILRCTRAVAAKRGEIMRRLNKIDAKSLKVSTDYGYGFWVIFSLEDEEDFYDASFKVAGAIIKALGIKDGNCRKISDFIIFEEMLHLGKESAGTAYTAEAILINKEADIRDRLKLPKIKIEKSDRSVLSSQRESSPR